MKSRKLMCVAVLTLLAAVPAALASSTWYVDSVRGSDKNNCKSPQHACKTIGRAISIASSGDSVMVAAATYTENLIIGFSLKVIGFGATTTIIDGGHVSTAITISNTSSRVIFSKLTIQNGVAQLGGGINNSGTLTITDSVLKGNAVSVHCLGCHTRGGGVYNGGRLTISNSSLIANSAAHNCTFCQAEGGGIYNRGTLAISNSTLTQNVAYDFDGGGGEGGGIYNSGTLTINNSALYSNEAGDRGGSIHNDGMLTVNNSTFSGDHAGIYGGGIHNNNVFGAIVVINNSTFSENGAIVNGGDIANFATATFQNSIVANSLQGGNCLGTMISKGYNLSSDNTCNFNGPGDLNNTDPKLGPLNYNGGPTPTEALLSGSPAIDAGNPNGCTDGNGHLLKTDQRGKPRPDREDKSGCDMGAYERQKD